MGADMRLSGRRADGAGFPGVEEIRQGPGQEPDDTGCEHSRHPPRHPHNRRNLAFTLLARSVTDCQPDQIAGGQYSDVVFVSAAQG